MIINRLLLNVGEGEGGAAGAGGGGGAGGAGAGEGGAAGGGGAGSGNANGASWYAPAEALKTSDPEIWQSFEKGVQSGNHKDFPTFVKHAIGLEKKLGSAISLPAKDAKPEEVQKWSKDLGEKVKGHGLALVKAQDAPPESPDKYEIKLDGIPEPLRAEGTVKAVREWAHKYGLSAAAVNELMGIEVKRYEETIKPIIEIDRKKSQDEFNVWASTINKEPKELEAYGGAWLAKNISETELKLLEKAGLADHPTLLKLVAKAGLDSGEDISVVEGVGDTDADAEFNEIMKMVNDPKHPDHDLWIRGNPQDPKRMALVEKYNAAFKKKYGTGEAK